MAASQLTIAFVGLHLALLCQCMFATTEPKDLCFLTRMFPRRRKQPCLKYRQHTDFLVLIPATVRRI
jgi:hypothetical protein